MIKTLGVPVGLIDSSYGGTSIEVFLHVALLPLFPSFSSLSPLFLLPSHQGCSSYCIHKKPKCLVSYLFSRHGQAQQYWHLAILLTLEVREREGRGREGGRDCGE